MPLWFVEFMIVAVFVPPLMFGLALLLLAATYMQVMDEEGNDGSNHEELHA